MHYRNPRFEHWPVYEDITDTYYRHGRFFYGEDRGGHLRVGRVVAFYRYLHPISTSAVEPVVRFVGAGGAEGEPEYVSLGEVTERWWIGRTADDVEQAWRAASTTGEWPHPQTGGPGQHRAAPFHVDPAHYLLYYAARDDDRSYLGRVVGWDPPLDPNELPTPIVRLYQPDGSLDEEGQYVGLDLPHDGYVAGTLNSARDYLDKPQ